MAEGNGELVDDMTNQKATECAESERTVDYSKLITYGLDKKV